MKNILIFLSFITLHNELWCMEEKLAALDQAYLPQLNERLELKEVVVQDTKEVLAQRINILLEKISDMEKNQKDQRSRNSKILTTISVIGSFSSTLGLLLYLASWYIKF